MIIVKSNVFKNLSNLNIAVLIEKKEFLIDSILRARNWTWDEWKAALLRTPKNIEPPLDFFLTHASAYALDTMQCTCLAINFGQKLNFSWFSVRGLIFLSRWR